MTSCWSWLHVSGSSTVSWPAPRCDSTVNSFHHWIDNPGSLVREAMAWACVDGMEQLQLDDLVQIMVQMKDFQDKAVRDHGTSIGVLCIGVPTSSIGLRDLCDVHHLLLQWNNSKIIDTKILHRIGCCLHMFNVFFRITQNDPCILWFFWYLMSHGSSARLASSSAFACNGHSSSATCQPVSMGNDTTSFS